jgi:hypothetical protein
MIIVRFILKCSLFLIVLMGIKCISKEGSINPYKGTKIGNTTVYAAMILTDSSVAGYLGRDFYRVPQGVNGTAVQNAQWRIENGKKTASELPFHVDFW